MITEKIQNSDSNNDTKIFVRYEVAFVDERGNQNRCIMSRCLRMRSGTRADWLDTLVRLDLLMSNSTLFSRANCVSFVRTRQNQHTMTALRLGLADSRTYGLMIRSKFERREPPAESIDSQLPWSMNQWIKHIYDTLVINSRRHTEENGRERQNACKY